MPRLPTDRSGSRNDNRASSRISCVASRISWRRPRGASREISGAGAGKEGGGRRSIESARSALHVPSFRIQWYYVICHRSDRYAVFGSSWLKKKSTAARLC